MLSQKNVPLKQLCEEFLDLDHERIHWIELSDFDTIQALRRLLDYTKKEFLTPEIRQYLIDMMKESFDDCAADDFENHRFCD